MGMFDYLECEYPLPGQRVELVDSFQTKCLGCTLANVLITEDGRLVGGEGSQHYTGTVEFYGSTIVGGGPSGVYTANGEDEESVTFLATFVDGKLTRIEQTAYRRQPALSCKEMARCERLKSQLNKDDAFLGKKLFVMWGGSTPENGYYVEVLYETHATDPRGGQLCVKKEDGSLELLDRFQIGRIILKDFEEAKAIDEHYKEQIKKAKEEHERKINEKRQSAE